MKTDALIQKLSGELTPANRVSPDRTAALLFLVFTGSLAGQLLLQTRRPDALALLTSTSFFFLVAFFLIGTSFLVRGLAVSAVPGRNSNFFRWSVAPFLLGLAAIYFIPISQSSGDLWHQVGGLTCVQEALLLALLPVGALFFVLRRQAVTHLARTGAIVGALGVAGSGLALSLCCPNSVTAHVATCHLILPAIFASVFAGLVGRWLLRW